jgi:hypothetical protein
MANKLELPQLRRFLIRHQIPHLKKSREHRRESQTPVARHYRNSQ